MDNIRIKRVYDEVAPGDGIRILVDRLWPRGLSKERARIDFWDKELAPSTELRHWFGHDPAKWGEFRKRYFEELNQAESAILALKPYLSKGPCVLLYAAHDELHNNAVALLEYLKEKKLDA